MDKDIFDAVIRLFDQLINDVHGEMERELLFNKKKDVVITAPEFIIDLLIEALRYRYHHDVMNVKPGDLGKHLVYRDITFLPGYEMAIVLHHKGYPLYRKEWMIKKILLEPPVTMQKEWYTETIVSINKLYGIGGKNYKSN